jgi:hypothetical protein
MSSDSNLSSSSIQSTSPAFWIEPRKDTTSFPHTYAPIVKNLEKLKKRGESSIVIAPETKLSQIHDTWCSHTILPGLIPDSSHDGKL